MMRLFWLLIAVLCTGVVALTGQSSSTLPSTCATGDVFSYTGTTPALPVVCIAPNVWVPRPAPDTLSALTDNVVGNSTTLAHGFLPKLGGGTSNFLRADGAWAAPPGGSGAPTDATYITQTGHAGLSAEQILADLATGIVKSTTGTGVLSIAVAGDFPTLNQATTGNAATATALAGNPADCTANQYATAIAASGAMTVHSTVATTTQQKE